MRRAIEAAIAGLVITAGWAVPALAGGSPGGVCNMEMPVVSDGWVAVGDNCFSPRILTVDAGQTVRWQLEGYPDSHTVSFRDGPDSGLLVTGESFGVRFNVPGTYGYVCIRHPGMDGTVQVVGTATGDPALQSVSQTGVPIESFDLAGGIEPGVAEPGVGGTVQSEQTVFSFDTMTATVILLLGLPISLGATYRLVGFGGPRPKQSTKPRR